MADLSALPALHAMQQPDVAGNLERLLALRSQLQMAPLQREALSQENQVRQIQLNDQQAMSSAMRQWDGKDPNDLPGLVVKAGGSANAVLGLRNSILDYQTKAATLTSDQIKNINDQNDLIDGHLEAVKSASAEGKQDAWASALDDLQKKGVIQAGQLPAQYPGDDQISLIEKAHMGQKAMLSKAQTESETSKNTAQALEAQTGAAKNVQEMQGLTGPFAEAKYRNILSAMSAGKPVSNEDMDFARGYEASQAKTTTQSDTLGVTSTNTSKPAGLASVTKGNRQGGKFVPQPGGANAGNPPPASPQSTKQSIVDLIGQYKMNPQLLSRMMYRHPELAGLVHTQYPDWDQTSYDAKSKIVQSYTSGPESKSINAINTAMGHAGELGQAIDALQNSNGLNMLRSIGNKLGVSVAGNDKVTAFNLIVHRLAPEITTAYVQGGGGEGERAANAEDFSASLGDKQLRTNLAETVKLLRSKISAQEQQWNTTYKPTRPEDAFETRFLTPQAKDTLQKYSPQAGGGAQHNPGGKAGLPEGTTGKGSDGKSYIVKGGVWVPAQ